MRYISTRGHPDRLSFNDVLLAGLAPDGGLYVPEEYPQLSAKDLEDMRSWSYHKICHFVSRRFIGKDIKASDLWSIIERSYDSRLFGSTDITPIQPIARDFGLLKLSNGPTLAFKDIALQYLANLMDHVLQERDEHLNILGATSGDTGSAAEEAVRGLERLRIFMLSPHGRMSEFQKMQMYRIHDPRVFNLVPDGNFDDCQAAVKLVNKDADFKEEYSIGAVNSINWARIMAQVVYYVYAYTRTVGNDYGRLTVSVPSGNFGNALAAYVAGRMGIKIRVLVATNENDVLHDFFWNGQYRTRKGDEVVKTQSPSMDIASASNFERLMFDQVGRNASHLVQLWKQLGQTGEFSWKMNLDRLGGIRFQSGSATDAEVQETIKHLFGKSRLVIDPHTAVALKVAWDQFDGNGLGPWLIAETAQPAKFSEAIEQAIGFQMPIPEACRRLIDVEDKIERITETDPHVIADEVKGFISVNT